MDNGIYNNISIDDYHANKTHISASQLKIAKKSLREYDWYRQGLIPKVKKTHFDFGNAFELALLNPIEFSENVAIMQDQEWVNAAMMVNTELVMPRGSKPYKEQLSQFYERNANKYHIMDYGKESYETIKHMLESCYQDKVIQELIKNVEYQISLFWTDPETGLNLKTRPDTLKRKKNVIVDIKTIEDGSPEAFGRDLAKYEYPLQAVMQIEGCIQTGLMEKVDNYLWLVVEKNPPYNATLYEFDQSDCQAFGDEFHRLLNKLLKAEKEKLFPGYSERADNKYGILKAEIPMWYKMQTL